MLSSEKLRMKAIGIKDLVTCIGAVKGTVLKTHEEGGKEEGEGQKKRGDQSYSDCNGGAGCRALCVC